MALTDWTPPTTDAECLREAASWFDLVDELISKVEVVEGGTHTPLVDKIGMGRGIQDALLRIAARLERLDA